MRPSLLACAGVLVLASSAAAALTSAQQACVNDMNNYGLKLAKAENGATLDCVENAGRGNITKLGTPPQQQTAEACLTNDVGGKVARATTQLSQREQSRCLKVPEQLPSFGYTSTAAVDASARAAGLAIVTGLFGPDLDAAIVSDDLDRDGARCQQDALRYTQDLFYDIWREVLTGKKNALKGAKRSTGTGQVGTAVDLAAELTAVVQGDAKHKISKSAAQLRDKIVDRCTTTVTPLGQLFLGPCGVAATPATLGACAETLARGLFYQTLAAFDGLALDCDLLDNGATDLSCESAELREHVLNRIGYGPDAWSKARIQSLGVAAYIQEQLSPASIDDSATDAALAQFPSLTMSFQDLRANYDNNPVPPQQGLGTIARELKQAKVLRAAMSHRQLAEVLVDFWQNHFNVAAGSSQRTKYDISPYDRIALRPNVLGSFENLLVADAKSPAMGDYLDNRRNHVGGLNENYAREVMELHTLSVTGPYTEADVPELARCLTGWRENYNNAVDGFQFSAAQHDQGTKTVIGVQIPANGGIQDGLTMLHVLATHPSTAAFIARKLVIRFVSETPPQRLIDEAAGVFLGSGGDLRAVMETILMSPEFLSMPQYRHAKVKRPLVFFASLARALGADPAQLNTNTIRNHVASLGEDLYDAGPPTGYPDASAYWFSPGTSIERFNEVEAVSRNQYGYQFTYPVAGGTSTQIVDALLGQIFFAPPASATRDTAIGFLDVLVEPNQTTRVRQAAAVLLASPEFLTH